MFSWRKTSERRSKQAACLRIPDFRNSPGIGYGAVPMEVDVFRRMTGGCEGFQDAARSYRGIRYDPAETAETGNEI